MMIRASLAGALGALACCSVCAAEPSKKPAGKGAPSPLFSTMPRPKSVFKRKAPAAPAGEPRTTMFRGGAMRQGWSAHEIPDKAPRIRWRYRTGRALFSSPMRGPDGALYVGSLDGHLHAVTAAGKPRWKLKLDGPVFSSPALHQGTVLVGSDGGTLYRVSADTGAVQWKVKPGSCGSDGQQKVRGFGPSRGTCAIDSSPLVDARGQILVASDAMYAVSAAGKVLWRQDFPGRAFSSPALAAGADRLFVGTQRRGALVALDLAGTLLWRVPIKGDVDATPAVAPGGAVIFGADDGKLRALDPATGEVRWRANLRRAVRSSAAVTPDGVILVGSDDRRLYAVDAEGQQLWRFRTGGRVRSSPVVDRAGRVLFGSQDDHLYALDAKGKLLWKVKLGADIDASPLVAPGGAIFIGADDGVLYALEK